MTSPSPLRQALEQTIELQGQHRLVVEKHEDRDTVKICVPSGQVAMTIEVTERGPVLRFDGANVQIQADGDLTLNADRLHLHGESGVTVSSRGDVHLQTPGDLHSHARIHHVEATRGNVNIRANDDVKLNGERVMVNC